METMGSFRSLAMIRTPLDLKRSLYQMSVFCPPGSNVMTCQIDPETGKKKFSMDQISSAWRKNASQADFTANT